MRRTACSFSGALLLRAVAMPAEGSGQPLFAGMHFGWFYLCCCMPQSAVWDESQQPTADRLSGEF